MMRIAYICTDPGIPVFGTKGASVHVQEIVRVLLEAGHTVDLYHRRRGGPTPAALALAAGDGRLELIELPPTTTREPAPRERELMAAEASLAGLLAERHAHRPYAAVYERYALFGRAGMRFARTHGIPGILEVNAPLPIEQRRHRVLVHEAEADAVAREVLADADVAVCVSEAVAEWARRQTPRARAIVVPNGVDVERIRPVSREAGAPFTVGFVGTLKPWHGTETLVEGFARFAAVNDAARLLLVGDGPEAPALRDRCRALGIADRVDFAGAVEPSEVPGWLGRMDIGVAPYPAGGDGYFSPLKLVEYMAAGLAVVASAVGQVPELLEHGRAGVLVPGSDPAALAGAFGLLASDPERRAQFGAAARAAVVGTRTWMRVAERSFDASGVDLRARAGAVA